MPSNGRGESISQLAQKKVRRFFSIDTLYKRVPVTRWMQDYNLESLEGDVMAGFTVGLTVIPQAIAYAGVAGLDPNYGLYSSFMGCFVYVFFGTSKDITIGPTAIMSIMTHEYSYAGSADFAILLCFLSGLIIFASGICNLGFLVTFISKPVIVGFTSAAAITIASSQLESLFGLKFDSEGLIDTLTQLFKNIGDTRWPDITLGVSCMVVLLLMRKLKDLKAVKPQQHDTTGTRVWKKLVFLMSVGRNAIVVIVAGIIAASLNKDQPFTITGEIQPGLPNFVVPPFHTTINGTYFSFSDMMSEVGIGLAIIPLISILESIAIASAFSGGKTIDATQEMLALGLCNIMGSFVQSYPVTGSFSRTAVNSTSGVKTPAGAIITGFLVVLALAFLTPYFKYIPKASLSAVIICAVIFMVEYEYVLPIWRVRRIDQLTLWGTFLTCLFWKLEYGILVGVGINLGILLYNSARPKINVDIVMKEESDEPRYVKVAPRSGLFFPSVDHVRTQVTKTAITAANGRAPVVVDCSHFSGIDFTASKGMKALCTDFERRQQGLVFTNITPGVERGLRALNEQVTIAKTPEELASTVTNGYLGSSGGGVGISAGRVGLTPESGDNDVTNPLLQGTNQSRPTIVPVSAD
ncbi:hypothetical protein Pcinc_017744 [Petrolisthes cinctipes]|uniref:Sodium-independent sulfate anion transporter n=1 Tax=Petrolisthes cinctipes TaxID=88211 RepID=A0AAE1FNK7_PETCI|nr:hypothetical protein Pcinc_017744 [Petrolisthes cinctipes]